MAKESSNSLILGLMSGTSLDGLDLALCEFSRHNEQFSFKIHECATVEYDAPLRTRLTDASSLRAEPFQALEADFSFYMAEEIKKHLAKWKQKPDAISSHGHTVFHQPSRGFTLQIGSGAIIAAQTGTKTVCDFRSTDVALGGQGAPLVPIGDKYLFKDYQACLNIGGIANISCDDKNGQRVAYDVCVANMLLNHLSMKKGFAYDESGRMAGKGSIIQELFENLNDLGYYKLDGPRSIGREWFETSILPIIGKYNDVQDLLATCTEHVAWVIGEELSRHNIRKVLVTGGGAFNKHLIDRIKHYAPGDVVVPEREIVNFKEALIFAFLGYLRLNEQINVLSSATGSSKDSCSGAVYL
jgi:anhydro-N-acetylmuramic acid kinase